MKKENLRLAKTVKVELTADEVKAAIVQKAGGKSHTVESVAITSDGGAVVVQQGGLLLQGQARDEVLDTRLQRLVVSDEFDRGIGGFVLGLRGAGRGGLGEPARRKAGQERAECQNHPP